MPRQKVLRHFFYNIDAIINIDTINNRYYIINIDTVKIDTIKIDTIKDSKQPVKKNLELLHQEFFNIPRRNDFIFRIWIGCDERCGTFRNGLIWIPLKFKGFNDSVFLFKIV